MHTSSVNSSPSPPPTSTMVVPQAQRAHAGCSTKCLSPPGAPRLLGAVAFLWLQHCSSEEKQEAWSQEVAGPVRGQCSLTARGAWLASIKLLQGNGVFS